MSAPLVLEVKGQEDKSDLGNGIMLTPPLEDDYWLYRVRLSDTQAIVGFPKFGTVGVGFAREDEDWNTNLPFTCGTDEIYDHIAENKGDDSITREQCVEAIRMIQDAAAAGKAATK